MFDPGKESTQSHLLFMDHIRQTSAKSNSSCTRYENWDSRRVRFENLSSPEDQVSDVPTPPLWTTSPHTSPPPRQNQYRCLSPKSKAQAIAKGQRELMEMVSRMPESCFELSLKDIVEQPMVEARQEKLVRGGNVFDENTQRTAAKENKRRNDRNEQMKRSGSIENGGFLLKMVFPVGLGSKKTKKKLDSSTGGSCKVSPRPSVSDGSAKGGENEWWKKRFSVSVSESESGESSTTNSGSRKSTGSGSSRSSSIGGGSSITTTTTNNNNTRRGNGGCWPFIRINHKTSGI